MSEFNREILEQVVAACETHRDDVARALGQVFESAVDLTIGTSGPLNLDRLAPVFRTGGIAIILPVGAEAAVLFLPKTTGPLPQSYLDGQAPSDSSFSTLGTQVGQLLPSSFAVQKPVVISIPNFEDVLRLAANSESAAFVEFQVRIENRSESLLLVWPGSVDLLLSYSKMRDTQDQKTGRNDPHVEKQQTATARSERQKQIHYQEVEEGIAQLPCYSRSLLKIKVPVMVTLAESRQPVENVLNIGPGSIIHFNKSCEDTLTLEVAEQKIAVGEAVKVGDKFGLWITSMILPEERFWVINDRPIAERAK